MPGEPSVMDGDAFFAAANAHGIVVIGREQK
jgi:hypothetical protein